MNHKALELVLNFEFKRFLHDHVLRGSNDSAWNTFVQALKGESCGLAMVFSAQDGSLDLRYLVDRLSAKATESKEVSHLLMISACLDSRDLQRARAKVSNDFRYNGLQSKRLRVVKLKTSRRNGSLGHELQLI